MNGFDISEFDELIKQIERLGLDHNKVAEKVLDAGSEPAMKVFKKHIPVDTTTPEDKRRHEHAKDNIEVSRTRKSKRGNKFRLIGAFDKKFSYLYYKENGTIRMNSDPFTDKAYKEAQKAAIEPMKKALIKEIEDHLK